MTLAMPRDMLKYVRIDPGMRAADFGAGSGAYTDLLMERVGTLGRVYALDALPQAIDALYERARARGARVFTLVTPFEDPLPMADNTIDLSVIANTLHGVDPARREHFVSEVGRVLAPRGQVLVVDWAGSFRNMGPAPALLAAPLDMVRIFRSQGFTTSSMLPAGSHHYAFVATRAPL
ncbi:methyltransferase domain-containing protein [Patescibacteria group bacterium]|nr:methyltransferase domain-containing protein [Patescibacteria group bacterium]